MRAAGQERQRGGMGQLNAPPAQRRHRIIYIYGGPYGRYGGIYGGA